MRKTREFYIITIVVTTHITIFIPSLSFSRSLRLAGLSLLFSKCCVLSNLPVSSFDFGVFFFFFTFSEDESLFGYSVICNFRLCWCLPVYVRRWFRRKVIHKWINEFGQVKTKRTTEIVHNRRLLLFFWPLLCRTGGKTQYFDVIIKYISYQIVTCVPFTALYSAEMCLSFLSHVAKCAAVAGQRRLNFFAGFPLCVPAPLSLARVSYARVSLRMYCLYPRNVIVVALDISIFRILPLHILCESSIYYTFACVCVCLFAKSLECVRILTNAFNPPASSRTFAVCASSACAVIRTLSRATLIAEH